jgi:molybdopterin-guanine dinucleotide biosynthesis protein A
MGRDKATLPFGDETLLERVVRRVKPAVDEVVVVSRPGQDLPALEGVVHAHDEVLDRGPLGGLLPGLRATSADAAFATACDVPFLKPEVVDLLFGALGDEAVAVAEAEGRLHPLAAVYRREVAPEIERLLVADRLRPVYLYERVPTVRVPEARLRAVDPLLRSLRNLNAPEDHERALSERPLVTVELYETARQRAGLAEVEVEAETLGEALRELARRCPALDGDVVHDGRPAPHWRTSLGGDRFVDDPSTPLHPGDALLVISALAGG